MNHWRTVEIWELSSGDLIAVKIFGSFPRVDLYHIVSIEETDIGTRKIRYLVTHGSNEKVFLENTDEDKWSEFSRRAILFRDMLEVKPGRKSIHNEDSL